MQPPRAYLVHGHRGRTELGQPAYVYWRTGIDSDDAGVFLRIPDYPGRRRRGHRGLSRSHNSFCGAGRNC